MHASLCIAQVRIIRLKRAGANAPKL
jgi:hypothetical protein